MSHWIRFKYIELPLRMQIGAHLCVYFMCVLTYFYVANVSSPVCSLRVRFKENCFSPCGARVYAHTGWLYSTKLLGKNPDQRLLSLSLQPGDEVIYKGNGSVQRGENMSISARRLRCRSSARAYTHPAHILRALARSQMALNMLRCNFSIAHRRSPNIYTLRRSICAGICPAVEA